MQTASGPRVSDAEVVRRVRALLADSETRQNRELALRIRQLAADIDAQRRVDLATIQQGLQVVDGGRGGDAPAALGPHAGALPGFAADAIEVTRRNDRDISGSSRAWPGVRARRAFHRQSRRRRRSRPRRRRPRSPPPEPQSAEARATARHRRDEMGVMEGVLTAAVRLGAAQIARELQAAGPGPSGLIGQPKARGFILEGYGIFFNVEIPTLQTSVVWSMQQLQRDQEAAGQSLDAFRSLVERLPDPEARAPVSGGPQAPRAAGRTRSRSARPTPAPEPAPRTFPRRPRTRHAYTKAVISSCLDAMLEHSKPMNLTADEWLTVALSSTESTLPSNQLYESTTVVLRVKGSDLADYLAGRITRDQVRAKVEVREF